MRNIILIVIGIVIFFLFKSLLNPTKKQFTQTTKVRINGGEWVELPIGGSIEYTYPEEK